MVVVVAALIFLLFSIQPTHDTSSPKFADLGKKQFLNYRRFHDASRYTFFTEEMARKPKTDATAAATLTAVACESSSFSPSTEDLLGILSRLTGRSIDLCRKQHLSRAKAMAKIMRCARKRWGHDGWDRELTRTFGVCLRSETPPPIVSVSAGPTRREEMRARTFTKAFTAVATHLLLTRVRCPEGELGDRTHVVWCVGDGRVGGGGGGGSSSMFVSPVSDDARIVVPNIVGAWQKPISRYVLTLFAYLYRSRFLSSSSSLSVAATMSGSSSSSSSSSSPVSGVARDETTASVTAATTRARHSFSSSSKKSTMWTFDAPTTTSLVRCVRDEGLAMATWTRLVVDGADHVRRCALTCGHKEGRAVCLRGGMSDPKTRDILCTLILDLPLNPSGKGWASPRQQHDLCLESGMQFFGNASVSWSAQLGLNATEDHRTRHADVIAGFVEFGRGGGASLYARRDLPPGLPLGFGWDDDDDCENDENGDGGDGGGGGEDPKRSPTTTTTTINLKGMRVSTASSRSNVVVYAPCVDVRLYCVGRRGIRAGTELTHNGRFLRPKHHAYYGAEVGVVHDVVVA